MILFKSKDSQVEKHISDFVRVRARVTLDEIAAEVKIAPEEARKHVEKLINKGSIRIDRDINGKELYTP